MIYRWKVDSLGYISAAESIGVSSITFYRAAWNAECRRGLAMRKLSVCPSVCCLSVKRVDSNKTEEKSVQIFILYERSFSLPEILGQLVLVGAKSSILNRYSPDVTPSEKSSINTNRKSTTRFPMSLRWSSYVAPKPPKGVRKRKTADFRLKSQFAWRKSATKFLCEKTVSGKVVRHSLSSYYPCKKWLVGATPSTWNFGSNWPRWSDSPIFDLFSLVAT